MIYKYRIYVGADQKTVTVNADSPEKAKEKVQKYANKLNAQYKGKKLQRMGDAIITKDANHNVGSKFRNSYGAEITVVEPTRSGEVQYKIVGKKNGNPEIRKCSKETFEKILKDNGYRKVNDASGYRVVQEAYNALNELGYNNSTGKYDEIVKAIKSIYGQTLLDAKDPRFKSMIKTEVIKQLKRRGYDSCKVEDSNANANDVKALTNYINSLPNKMSNSEEKVFKKQIEKDLERIRRNLVSEFKNISGRGNQITFQGSMREISGYINDLRNAMKNAANRMKGNNNSFSSYLFAEEKALKNWANSNFIVKDSCMTKDGKGFDVINMNGWLFKDGDLIMQQKKYLDLLNKGEKEEGKKLAKEFIRNVNKCLDQAVEAKNYFKIREKIYIDFLKDVDGALKYYKVK